METLHPSILEKLENEWRELFLEDGSNEVKEDLHFKLINVFENRSLFNFTEENDIEKAIPKILYQNRVKSTDRDCSVVDENKFFLRWKEFHRGLFDGFEWDNVVVAGGSVLACLLSGEDGEGSEGGIAKGFEKGDIDIYFYGIDAESEKIQDMLQRVLLTFKNNVGASGTVRISSSAITIALPYPYRLVQVILCCYQTPAEVVLLFDIDCCCVLFDGENVWATERCRRALTKRYNYYTTSASFEIISPRYEDRLFKYSRRGFGVACPNLTPVPSNIEDHRLNELQGIPYLQLLEMLRNRPHVHFPVNISADIDEAINGGKIVCKYCFEEIDEDTLDDKGKERLDFYGINHGFEWETVNLSYQDIEFQKKSFPNNGNNNFNNNIGDNNTTNSFSGDPMSSFLFRRRFMSGQVKYDPTYHAAMNWRAGVYVGEDHVEEISIGDIVDKVKDSVNMSAENVDVVEDEIVEKDSDCNVVVGGENMDSEESELDGDESLSDSCDEIEDDRYELDVITELLLVVGDCYRKAVLTEEQRGYLKNALLTSYHDSVSDDNIQRSIPSHFAFSVVNMAEALCMVGNKESGGENEDVSRTENFYEMLQKIADEGIEKQREMIRIQ